MSFAFTRLTNADARSIVQWRYEPPYDVYNIDAGEIEVAVDFFADPANCYYSITDGSGELAAFCCFGRDAQVSGGDYSAKALDIGLGVRPDLTGKGNGLQYVNAVLDFARRTFSPTAFRVTVAEFNKRAFRVWEKAGFRPMQTFQASQGGQFFVMMLRNSD
jgi:RimJ/RimL family protein N-acetyltransferase